MIILSLITFAASLVTGISGFGFALVTMGLFPLVITVKEANMLVSVLALPVIIVNIVPGLKSIKPRELVPVMASIAVGLPLGIFFLVKLDERTLLICLGAVILAALLSGILFPRRKLKKPPGWVAAAAGLVSGAFGGAYGVSGPPITLYFSRFVEEKLEFKTNLLACFLFVSIVRIIYFTYSGMVTGETLGTVLVLLIPLAAGTVSGALLFKRIPSKWVLRIVRSLLAISSVLLIGRAI